MESARSLGNGALAGMLDGTDHALAARAALAIGRTKDRNGVALLARHLHDADVAIRAMAVYGMGLLATGANAEGIVAAAGDKAAAVRIAALDAVGRYEVGSRFEGIQENAAVQAVAKVLRADTDPIVRARAATALEAFQRSREGDFASRSLVNALFGETNQDVRWHIMWSVYRGYAVRVPRQFLNAALHDPNELVRIEAVRAYGRLKDKQAVADIQALTNDSSWRVQLQALESIKALKGEPPTEHLKEMPPGVHVPPVKVQTYMEIALLPRPVSAGKPAAPSAQDAVLTPRISTKTAAGMTGPAPGPHPRVRIHTTKGTMIVTLFPEWAPLTVANFLNLTNRGYFDGLRWFRIVPDFVVQTGDPSDSGDGDAGYSVPAEENPLEQRSNVISMGLNYDGARPLRDSAGTQFYITLSPQLHLNRDFTVFGEVTDGLDVLGRLVETDRMQRVEQIPDSR